MALFVICGITDEEKLHSALSREFPDDHLRLQDGGWLVSGTGTTQQIAKRADLTEGDDISGIVFRTTTYYGLATAEIWEWIALKLESGDG